jgi:hypothetical protein
MLANAVRVCDAKFGSLVLCDGDLLRVVARFNQPPELLAALRKLNPRAYRVDQTTAAVACSRVQRNSAPSTQMRCMITANRRASATIAFFIPRRLAIYIAQALSHDHFFERSML